MLLVTAIALSVVLACIAASVKRLWYATNPTALDARELVRELSGDKGRVRFADVCRAIRETPAADWERELVDALALHGDARVAGVNEQLAELDYRLQRWARVPRVCASISSSAGFLLAAMAMRIGLARIDMAAEDALHDALNDAALDALGIAALGMWGTVTCIAVQARARRASKARLDATDKLVERMEALSSSFS